MTSKSLWFVALSLLVLFACPAPLRGQSPTPSLLTRRVASAEANANVQVDEILRRAVAELLAKSRTFRQQWDTINASRLVRVRVLAIAAMQDQSRARARAQVSRYARGGLRATIELPAAVDLTELLPHELEHVIEQIEGLDLRQLAQHGQGVVEVRRGVYETARARHAGLQVMREVYGEVDPAVAAALGGVKRFLRALGSPPDRIRGPGQSAATRLSRGATLPQVHKRQ